METAADPRSIDFLRTLRPFQGVPAWTLEAVAEAIEEVSCRKGQRLLERGTDDGYTYFLVDGHVALEAGNGERQEMLAGSDTVTVPLANLRPRVVSVKALNRVSGFRIPDLVVSTALEGTRQPPPEANREGGEADTQQVRQRELETELGFRLHRDLQLDNSVLPSLPDVALKIRKAIEDHGSDARDIAKWIEQDPAMTAKVIKTANSAFYSRREPVDTCSAAVVRLGTRATKKLVMTFCMREVFQPTKPALTRRLQELWAHCADVAALSFVLAHKARGFAHDPEEVMLAGLLHDVGTIAVLNYAQKIPRLAADPAALGESIRRLRGEMGAMVLRKWNFAPEIVAAARDAEHWLRKRKGLADITDVVIVAQMHDHLHKGGLAGLPPMDEISAVKRVLGRQVTPDTSIEVIREAQAQSADVRALLDA